MIYKDQIFETPQNDEYNAVSADNPGERLTSGDLEGEREELIEGSADWTSTEARHTNRSGDDSQTSSEEPLKVDLPQVSLPGGKIRIVSTAAELGRLLAATFVFFLRGGTVMKLGKDDLNRTILRAVKPAALASAFEGVARIVKVVESKHGDSYRPAIFSESAAKMILESDAFRDALPSIRVLSRCPVLVEQTGALKVIVGYDRQSGVYAEGTHPTSMPLDKALQVLIDLLKDFRFATEADRSRALAAIITPALVFGGILGGRAPVDLGEANQSQTGKGYRNKLTAAIYGWEVTAITQRKGGVGALEETFNQKLIEGANFISLDNMRGKIDSPCIESFLTEDGYTARAPYGPNMEIDPRRVVLMLTSNKADITVDLGNRSSCVRILKQPSGYDYANFPEGDILDHVRAHQPKYLGAVFTIVKAWHEAGKPRTKVPDHDFRKWAQTLDWIVQNLLGCAPLLEGHRETQQRITNPHLNWLRDVALIVEAAGRCDEWLLTNQLVELMDGRDVEIPGAPDCADLQDGETLAKAWRGVGKRVATCFAGSEELTIDGITIEKRQTYDDERRQRHEYRFLRLAPQNTEDSFTVAELDPDLSPNAHEQPTQLGSNESSKNMYGDSVRNTGHDEQQVIWEEGPA